jgi:hypothetical protein
VCNSCHGFRGANHQQFFQDIFQFHMPFALVRQGWMRTQIGFTRAIGKFRSVAKSPSSSRSVFFFRTCLVLNHVGTATHFSANVAYQAVEIGVPLFSSRLLLTCTKFKI